MRTFAIIFSFFLLTSQFNSIHSQNIDSLKRVLTSDCNDSIKAITLNKLAEVYYDSNPDSSIVYYKKCLDIAKKVEVRYTVLNDLALLYSSVSNYSEAQDCYLECLKIAVGLKDSLLALTAHSNLGNLYIQIELNDKAIYHLNEASKLINNSKNFKEAAKLYGRIGNFYLYQGYLDAAEQNYKKAIVYFEKGNILKGKIIATQNLGVIERRRKNYSKALEYYNEALSAYKTIGFTIGIGQCLANIGNIYVEKKEYKPALTNLYEALTVFKKTKQLPDEIVCYSEIAEIYLEQKQYAKALELVSNSKKYLDSLPENSNTKLEVLNQLQFIYNGLGNKDLAYKYLLEYDSLNSSLYSSKLKDKIESLRIQYEVGQKDKDLKYLTLENELKDTKIRRKSLFQAFYLLIIGLSALVIASLYILFRSKKKANRELVAKNTEITQQKEEIEAQREEIEAQRDDLEVQRSIAIKQRDEISRQKKNITDSIAYAKHIQTALLPNESEVKEVIPDSFIFFKPLDIVSGDFYWVNKSNGQSLVAVADCTGHGVPGAFMSVMGINFLNSLVIEQGKVNPDGILTTLNEYVIKALSHADSNLQDKDGMDIALCGINWSTLEMQYSCAKIKILICRNGSIIQLGSDKYSIGKSPIIEKVTFSTNSFQLEKGDVIYLMTDGYVDQFGGENRVKFLANRFNELAKNIYSLSMNKQLEMVDKTIKDWQGSYPQVDDMLVVGIRI